MNTQLKRNLRNLYFLSPVLWAVVKGYDTEELIADKLGKDRSVVSRGITSALYSRLLREDDGQLCPVNWYHKRLARQLRPDVAVHEPAKAQLLDLMPNHPVGTQEMADLAARAYNSTYKSLRRMEQLGLVERQGKLWAKV